MQRFTSPALYAASVAAGLVLTGAGALSATTARQWSELAMALVMAPALAWLAIDYWIARHVWYGALFGALAVERLYLLAQITGTEGQFRISPNGLVPIVMFLSIVLFRLAFGRILARLLTYATRNLAETTRRA